jgi:peptidoglycan/LPS O-acetylase OafA/YrhL
MYTIGNCVITFAVAIILTLTVEMPFGKLEKRFTTPRRTDMNQIYNKV